MLSVFLSGIDNTKSFFGVYAMVFIPKYLCQYAFFNHQAADLQPKPDGKITQTVNMVQLLTVRTNHLQITKFVVLPKKR